ncbi:MAG: EamA family transporter [Chloroflexota bacterium]|nr:EamA family transporter [Chloroflexota bacterium]
MVWLPLALFALVTWSVQRVVTKVALLRWTTARFYRWNAIVSLLVYLPYAVVVPPRADALVPAIGLSLLMALTFGVTTEATRRGPIGVVAPLTATSPALTVLLAVALLGERSGPLVIAGVGCAIIAAILLAARPAEVAIGGWLALALASLTLQGIGAFIAKIVVTDGGPTTLLLTSVIVQLAVGVVIARGVPLDVGSSLRGMPLIVTLTLAAAAVATIGYLSALSVGPASVIVPLVATSPALGGLLGIIALKERVDRRQAVGIAVGVLGIIVLARPT